MFEAAIPLAFAIWAGSGVAIDQAVESADSETVASRQIEQTKIEPLDDSRISHQHE